MAQQPPQIRRRTTSETNYGSTGHTRHLQTGLQPDRKHGTAHAYQTLGQNEIVSPHVLGGAPAQVGDSGNPPVLAQPRSRNQQPPPEPGYKRIKVYSLDTEKNIFVDIREEDKIERNRIRMDIGGEFVPSYMRNPVLSKADQEYRQKKIDSDPKFREAEEYKQHRAERQEKLTKKGSEAFALAQFNPREVMFPEEIHDKGLKEVFFTDEDGKQYNLMLEVDKQTYEQIMREAVGSQKITLTGWHVGGLACALVTAGLVGGSCVPCICFHAEFFNPVCILLDLSAILPGIATVVTGGVMSVSDTKDETPSQPSGENPFTVRHAIITQDSDKPPRQKTTGSDSLPEVDISHSINLSEADKMTKASS